MERAGLVERVRRAAPAVLDQVVVDLLLSMGNGGGDADRGRLTGGTGDEGIDGAIREDALGLRIVVVEMGLDRGRGKPLVPE